MVKPDLSLTIGDVISSIRQHLEIKGYSVTHQEDKYALSVEITAKKGRETFLIEGIWETDQPPEQSITYAIGKIVKRMRERGAWTDYGIAMPKSYFKALRDFEIAGFETLGVHLFLIESFYVLTHLHKKLTLELIQHLKEGNVSQLNIWGINYE